jgi:signal transduction histidine kinase
MMAFLRSMAGRVFLILLLGIVAAAALTWWLAFGERQRVMGQFREAHAVERVEQLILALEAVPAAQRPPLLQMANRFGLRVEPMAAGTNQAAAGSTSRFASALAEHLGPEYHFMSLPMNPADCRPRRRSGFDMPPPPLHGCEALAITLRDGSMLRLTAMPPRNPMPPPPRPDFMWYLLLFLSIIGLLAYLVARMTMRPLIRLAQAADDLGKDINQPPLRLNGASEIRQASGAFNAMQARIRQHIQQRTQMLAAITHDLQTPLTRLRLRLEKVDDAELRDKLVGDLSAMQHMVREGLELARSMDTVEPLQPLDLDSLLDSVCSDAADAGQAVTLTGQVGMPLMARPLALRRCLINLFDNAVKYGQYARVTLQRDAGVVLVRIRDGGPGIAPEQLQKVFEPFYRTETSRSRDTGGTGLGLTIARNIAEQHGGSLTLANHPEGGLEATLALPLKLAGR